MDGGRDEFRNRTKAAAEVNATKFGRCVYVANGAISGICGELYIYICKVHSQKGPSALTCKPHEVLQGKQCECAFSKAPRATVGVKIPSPVEDKRACWAGMAKCENKWVKQAG